MHIRAAGTEVHGCSRRVRRLRGRWMRISRLTISGNIRISVLFKGEGVKTYRSSETAELEGNAGADTAGGASDDGDFSSKRVR